MKATKTAKALASILPNIGDPLPAKKKKLLGGVVSSQLLYAAPCWASSVIKREHCVKQLRATSRKAALRVIMAYRTVLFKAASLLSSMTPIELSALERDKCRASLMQTKKPR